jgi:hypothetical protein
MRKRIVRPAEDETVVTGFTNRPDSWLDLEAVAEVELTSEHADFPIEAALVHEKPGGWRAAEPGDQTIRLRFQSPQRIERITLEFSETERQRTQEFVLRHCPAGSDSMREIVRQQWNFSPGGSMIQQEDYQMDLDNVAAIELTIFPDIEGGDAIASLERLRVG